MPKPTRCQLPINNPNSPNATDTLAASVARTTSASSVPLAGFNAAKNLVVQLAVTAASGTTPTLNLVIEDTVDGINWNTIATFAQMTATGAAAQRVTMPFTDQIRATWTIGGTTPSFTFSVQIYSDI